MRGYDDIIIKQIKKFELKGTKTEIKKQLDNMGHWMRELYKIDGTIKDKYIPSIYVLSTQTKKAERYYGNRWIISGGRKQLDTTAFDRTSAVVKAFNLNYRIGNDGKRGGAEHDYIEITKDKRKSFYKI